MNGLIGKKLGMSQIFLENGNCVPVTVVAAGPCKVTQIRTVDKDGYEAVQIGFGSRKESRSSKAQMAHFAKAGAPVPEICCEFRGASDVVLGADVTVSIFEGVKSVQVRGTTKGRGFAGTIKRYRFHRGRETHGNVNHRAPGSIGAHTFPARVFPGQKLPGHYGDESCTIRNLKLVKIDAEQNLLFIKGAIPGPINGRVIVEKM